jgi:hypothetical protein
MSNIQKIAEFLGFDVTNITVELYKNNIRYLF